MLARIINGIYRNREMGAPELILSKFIGIHPFPSTAVFPMFAPAFHPDAELWADAYIVFPSPHENQVEPCFQYKFMTAFNVAIS